MREKRPLVSHFVDQGTHDVSKSELRSSLRAFARLRTDPEQSIERAEANRGDQQHDCGDDRGDLLPDGDDPDTPSSHVDWRDLPEEQLLGQEAQERLWAEIARLPEGLRAAFTLRDVEGLTTADCAHVQSITEAAYKVRLHRARLLLRERLSDYFAEWAHRPGAHEGEEI